MIGKHNPKVRYVGHLMTSAVGNARTENQRKKTVESNQSSSPSGEPLSYSGWQSLGALERDRIGTQKDYFLKLVYWISTDSDCYTFSPNIFSKLPKNTISRKYFTWCTAIIIMIGRMTRQLIMYPAYNRILSSLAEHRIIMLYRKTATI